jgi:excinuclease ABC subunit B
MSKLPAEVKEIRDLLESVRQDQPFKAITPHKPSGDQPKAISEIVKRIRAGEKDIVLLGATGTGKSATTAWIIEELQRPALIIEPNRTLAAQIAQELREMFPNNKVEYFVSYYDYYQPEAYIPQTDTFIEKDATINQEVERLRHSATNSLLTRRDVIVVASVSCIYGLGHPAEYLKRMLFIERGQNISRDALLRNFVQMQYTRNDIGFVRGTFRVRGDTIEIIPMYEELAIRLEMFGDEIDRILIMHPITGEVLKEETQVSIFPASHYVAGADQTARAISQIREELEIRLAELNGSGKLLEAQRLQMRTNFDLEMMQEMGTCSGIENYSRHMDGRAAGSAPHCLLDYFPEDFLLVIDESHVTVPQIGAMYEGDASRKRTLVEHGFRLPSALDNRPLKFNEFLDRIDQTLYLSATPGPYELNLVQGDVVEQVIRPTGLIDPLISVRPTKGQIDDLLSEINTRISKSERVLVTTLTKRMAEELTDYLSEQDIAVRYLHSDVKTLERVALLRGLRLGEFDVLVGINLLREGLDLPEVSLVAILDADKEGFLRSERSLIQTIGRAARNVTGEVVMYADRVTDSMQKAISETSRRRELQLKYNKDNGIDPTPLQKKISDISEMIATEEGELEALAARIPKRKSQTGVTDVGDLMEIATRLTEQMRIAAEQLQFEIAASLRDEISEIKREIRTLEAAGIVPKAEKKKDGK